MQGAQILRNEAYLRYAAVTKGAAQRSSWTFYEAIKLDDFIQNERMGSCYQAFYSSLCKGRLGGI